MKKLLAFLLVIALSCNSQIDKKNNTAHDVAAETHKEHAAEATGLALNNGAKWKADSTTKLNVALLQNIISNTKKESTEDYHQTAKQLQDGLNKMIDECKMTGADHTALHQWLEPIIEKTEDLKNADSTVNTSVIISDIENQINLFQQYFE